MWQMCPNFLRVLSKTWTAPCWTFLGWASPRTTSVACTRLSAWTRPSSAGRTRPSWSSSTCRARQKPSDLTGMPAVSWKYYQKILIEWKSWYRPEIEVLLLQMMQIGKWGIGLQFPREIIRKLKTLDIPLVTCLQFHFHS